MSAPCLLRIGPGPHRRFIDDGVVRTPKWCATIKHRLASEDLSRNEVTCSGHDLGGAASSIFRNSLEGCTPQMG
jgi:hypothetical protein